MKKYILLLTICFAFISSYTQQVFPVTGNVVMTYPSPIFLYDYYEAGATNLQVTIKLNDFSIPSQNVKIKFTIENGDIELSTKNEFSPITPIILTPGAPIILQGSDLLDALNTNNLNLKGISRTYLNANGGKLPEGQYNFCMEVLDYSTSKPISLPACASVFLQLEQAPLLLSPTCEENIMPSNPQQIRFSWQTSGSGQPSVAGFTTYKVFLYQITEKNLAEPKNAVLNSKAVSIYESGDLTLNNLNLDFSTVLLVPGEQYVYRVKATGPNGKETFANDGYSEWCWFNYGYLRDGVIALSQPFDGKQFDKNEQKVFSWGVSDKGTNGQAYDYKLTIVELLDTNQDIADALLNNASFHEETLPPTSSQDGANFLLNKALNPDQKYAWKIEAFSSEQKVAESAPSSFYSHSLIDYFYASNQKIKVIQVTNKDLENLSGKCRVQLSEDETNFVDVNFSNLKIKDITGQLVLTGGEINFNLSDKEYLNIEPEFEGNGPAKFEYVSGKIDKTGLKVDGRIKWTIPHNVLPGEKTDVITKTTTFVMNSNGQLSGENGIELFNTILINPNGFELELKPTSILQLSNNKFVVNLIGSVTLPENIKSKNGQKIKIEFKNQQNQLDYIQIDNLIGSVSSGFAPISNLMMEIIPVQGAVIDLSESKSPGKLAGDKSWKGLYINKYKTRLHARDFDNSKQIKIPNQLDYDGLTEGTENKIWIDGSGITLKTTFAVNEVDGVTFNSFQSNIKGVFDIKKSVINTAKITGETSIPFLDKENKFTFDILATEEGLEEGFLNQDLTELNLVYNPFGGENRMEIAINRAVFEENERLTLNVDITIPELKAKIESLEGLRVYGDNFIGVDGKNTSKALENFAPGKFKELKVDVTDFGAAFLGGKYTLSYQVETNLGAGLTGDDGPPKMVINSVTATDATLASESESIEPTLEVPKDADPSSSEIKTNSFIIKISTPVVDATGRLIFTENDPVWGTKFEGGIDALLKQPGEIAVGANIVVGSTGDLDYWYFDAYFEDRKGTGVDCQFFYLTAFEGKIYSNMKASKDEQNNFKIDLDPTIRFGIAAYVQLIDKESRGFNWMLDGGLELEFKGPAGETNVDNVVAKLSLEGSFLNSSSRSSQTGGLVGSVKQVVQEEVANFALDQVFPQNFSVSGTDITIDAKSLKEGSLSVGNYSAGNGFKIGGSVDGTPSFDVGFAQSGFKIGGSANAEGSGSFEFELDGLNIATELKNMNAATFTMNIGDFATNFGGNLDNKQAFFGFKYGSDVNLNLDVNGSQQKGSFDIDVSGYNFIANADVIAKTAGIGFKKDNDNFNLSFDGNNGEANLIGEISGLALKTSFNASEKKGLFYLSTSSAEVDAEGSATGARFNVESGSTKFGIESNFIEKTGKVALSFPNNELKGEVGNDFASVFLKSNSLEIGANGKFDGTQGALHLKEGDFFLDLAADATNTLGSLNFGVGQLKLTSLYNPALESFIKFENGNDLDEARIAENYYKVHHRNGDYEFMLEQNTAKNSGAFLYKIPSFEFGGDFDPEANLARANISIEGDKNIEAYFKEDTAAINYQNGQQSFNIKGVQGGSGSVQFNDGAKDISTGFSYDQASSAGALHYKSGDFLLDIAANKTAGTGHYELSNSDFKFYGGFYDSIYSYNKINDLIIEAVSSTERTGVRYTNNSDKVSLYKLDNGASFSWDIDGRMLSLSKLQDDYYGNYKDGSLAISTYLNNDLANFSYQDGAFLLAGEVNVTNEDFYLTYKADEDSINLKGNNKQDAYSIAVKSGEWSGTASESIADKTAFFSLKKNNDGIDLGISPTKNHIGLSLGDFNIEGGNENAQNYLIANYGKANLTIDENIKIGIDNVSMKLTNINQSDFKLEVDIDNDHYELTPSQGIDCSFDFMQNGSVADFTNGKFEKAFGSKTMVISKTPQGEELLITDNQGIQAKINFSCDNIPSLTLIKDGTEYGFEINNDNTKLVAGDYKLTYTNQSGNIEILAANNVFKLTDEELEVKVGDYKLNATENSFLAEKGNIKILANNEKASVTVDDKMIEIKEDNSFTIQLASDKLITASPSSFGVVMGSKKLTVEENLFKVEESAASFMAEITDNSISVTQGDYSYSSNNDGVTMKHQEDFITVSSSSLTAKYGDREFNVTEDQSVSYSDQEKSFNVTKESLAISYEGTSLEVLEDKVKVGLAGNGVIEASKNQLKYTKDEYNIILDNLLETPSFSYNDGENFLDLASTGLALNIKGNELVVNNTKLFIKVDDNQLLLTENDLSFKYDRYVAEFTDWEDAFLSNGVQEFRVNKTELSATIDENNKVKTYFVNDKPAIDFTVNGDEYSVNTNGAEFDYAGQHFVMNPEEYLRVYETGSTTADGLYVDENGLKYKNGATELKLGTQETIIELIHENNSLAYSKEGDLSFTIDGTYVTTISSSDMSASFTDGTNIITLNKEEELASFANNDLKVALLKFQDGAYGVQAGTLSDYMFIKGKKGSDLSVGGDIGGSGLFEFSANKDLDLALSYNKGNSLIDLDIKKGKDLNKFLVKLDGNDFFAYDPNAEVNTTVAGIETVGMDGPTHISKITDGAGGWGKAKVVAQLSMTPNKFELIVNGGLRTGYGTSFPVLCSEASFGLNVKKDYFLFKLADPNDRAKFSLICMGGIDGIFKADGFARLEMINSQNTLNMDVDFGMKFGYEFKGEAGVSIGVGKLSCYVGFGLEIGSYFEFEAAAKIKIPTGPGGETDIDISKVIVGLGAYARVYASVCGYSFDLAGVAISGRLGMQKVGGGTRYFGEASGKLTVCGFSKGFDFNANFVI